MFLIGLVNIRWNNYLVESVFLYVVHFGASFCMGEVRYVRDCLDGVGDAGSMHQGVWCVYKTRMFSDYVMCHAEASSNQF